MTDDKREGKRTPNKGKRPELPTEERERLENERDFLLRSLDDLELEHESGGIDDESYRELHDDYTARAAAAIRALRDGVDTRPEPAAPVPTKRRVAIVAGIVVFAVVAGVALAAALGARLPGQTPTGNSAAASDVATQKANQKLLRTRIAALEAKANADPNDYQTRMDLALAYEQNGDLANALKQSDAAITIDPNRPEGHTNAARILYLVSEQIKDVNEKDSYIARAKAGFDTAITVGPDYADAYYFRAVLYAFSLRDFARSQIDLQNYIVKAPNGQWATQARTLLTQVTNALTAPSTTVGPPSTTKKK
jgi:cytochrome c-type biogenesis protein CcmH/NrfG